MTDDKTSVLRKQLQEQEKHIQELEKKLSLCLCIQSAIQSFPASLRWQDRDNVYLGCNEYQLRMAGLSTQEEIVGKTDFDMPWKDIAESMVTMNARVIRTGEDVIIEEAPKLADGDIIHMITKKAPLRNEQGEITGVISASIDISEYRKADIETRIYLETLLKSIPGIVYWKDIDGKYLGCNENLLTFMDFNSKSDLIGKCDPELWPKAQADKLRENDAQVMQSSKPLRFEEAITAEDGETRYYTAIKSSLKDINNNVIGVMGNSMDITELKKMQLALSEEKERAEAASSAKSEFLANMEHDLRTPASGIYSLTEILVENTTDETVKADLMLILDSSRELLKLLNEVLEFDQIEAGNHAILEKKFNLRELLDGVIKLEKSSSYSKNLEFSATYSKDLPRFIIGDAFRLNRILINIIGNAIKFTHKGYVKLFVSVIKQKDPRNIILRFAVEDTGIGIPKERQNFIFEKFIKATPANTKNYKGIGIGLRVVKQFIEELGGEIELESTMGIGTKFTFLLPVKIPLSEMGTLDD